MPWSVTCLCELVHEQHGLCCAGVSSLAQSLGRHHLTQKSDLLPDAACYRRGAQFCTRFLHLSDLLSYCRLTDRAKGFHAGNSIGGLLCSLPHCLPLSGWCHFFILASLRRIACCMPHIGKCRPIEGGVINPHQQRVHQLHCLARVGDVSRPSSHTDTWHIANLQSARQCTMIRSKYGELTDPDAVTSLPASHLPAYRRKL